jgi:error-prone DNA polymerase
MAFAELSCRSNFTFLEGASHPEELVLRAKEAGLAALAITDRDSLAGVVRAHEQARRAGLPLVIGAEVSFADAPPLVLLAQSLEGYENLCELISLGRLAVEKGDSCALFEQLASRTRGLLALDVAASDAAQLGRWKELFGDRAHVAVWNHLTQECPPRLEFRERLAREAGLPMVATNRPVMHVRARQRLQDVVSCIRLGTTVQEAGLALFPNAERIVKSEKELRRLFPRGGALVERAAELAASCTFSLSELKYRFPTEMLPPGADSMSFLRLLVRDGLDERYPDGVPGEVAAQARHELAMIEELDYPGYFLTVWDIVRFARTRRILCQGRGSAANSIVCYALGITSIDPVRMKLMFERFISRERNEPPDIDVDFEHERREEVMQYVYAKYGRDRAAMVAEVICYRGRSALREVAKAMGLPLDLADSLAKTAGHHESGPDPQALAATGLRLEEPLVRATLTLAEELQDFPRHLSIHSGGFVVTDGPLGRLVPLENGAMEGRTVIQWDKDDAASVGLLKIDLLSLGMLSTIARCFEMIRRYEGREYTLANVPAEDPAVYDMLCEADSVGVFQIESRAQMNMLPRMRPRCFYDLVIEVAIIRPGPIQGGMVHPFLRRRRGLEPVEYPHPLVKPILEKTLGVTLFQEQGMRLAVVAAGFSAGEADELRRAMTHKRSKERMGELKGRLMAGMARNGIRPEKAEEIFQQLMGFSGYGFPESHSASFALLVYASAYLKCHYPAVFAAALLNSQPMGFYAPHTLLEDARRHGIPSRPVDVFYSEWDCTLEAAEHGEGEREEDASFQRWRARPRLERPWAIRLGLRQVHGLRREHAQALVKAREGGPWRSLAELAHRSGLPRHALARLAACGALQGFGLRRREALWAVQGLVTARDDLFSGIAADEPRVEFEEPNRLERVAQDYSLTGLSSEDHPMALLRLRVRTGGLLRSDVLQRAPARRRVRVGGLVIVRQRPGTANGIVFISLEDECGFINLVVMPDVWERHKLVAGGRLFLGAEGVVERAGRVVNVKVERLFRLEFEENPVEAVASRDYR